MIPRTSSKSSLRRSARPPDGGGPRRPTDRPNRDLLARAATFRPANESNPLATIGSVGAARLAIIGAALGATVAAPTSVAHAGIAGQARALERASCALDYDAVHERPYNRAEQRRAMRGRFGVTDKNVRVKLDPPIDWSSDPINSKSFRGKLHALGYLDVLFYIYSASDRYDPSEKRQALRMARDIALDFVESNPLGGDGVDRKAWTNKVTADRAGYLAYVTRAAQCEGMLEDDTRRELLRSLGVHGRHIAHQRIYTPSNHGLFVDLGLGLLARYVPFIPGADHWDRLSQRRFRNTLLKRIDPAEGFWQEHSPGYQIIVLSALSTFVEATDPEDPLLAQLLDRMKAAAATFVMPDGTLPQFGDTPRQLAPRPTRDRAGEDDVPSLVRYVGSGEAERAGAAGLPGSLQGLLGANHGLTVFPKTGYAVAKETRTNSFLAVASSFHNLSHKHSDELSFELFEKGHRIVSDSGLYNKDDNRYREFQRSPEAHSTLIVDREGVKLTRNRAYGSGIVATGSGAGWHGILARNPLVRRQGVEHERLFLYQPGRALVVVDRVGARRRHLYERRFQLGPEIRVSPRDGAFGLSASGLSGELYDAAGTKPSKRSVVRGDTTTLEGFTFPRFRTRQKRTVVNYRSHERGAIHVTTFSLDPTRPVRAELPTGGSGDTVVLTSGGRPISRVTGRRRGSSSALDVTVTPILF